MFQNLEPRKLNSAISWFNWCKHGFVNYVLSYSQYECFLFEKRSYSFFLFLFLQSVCYLGLSFITWLIFCCVKKKSENGKRSTFCSCSDVLSTINYQSSNQRWWVRIIYATPFLEIKYMVFNYKLLVRYFCLCTVTIQKVCICTYD